MAHTIIMISHGFDFTQEPIDAVYTWVESFTPELHAVLGSDKQGLTEDDSASSRRFRDNGELKYSLRSLERYAPWIRNVFIVHAGNPPSWLNASIPNLYLISHEEIFPDPSVLPIFNSYAIELNLHRIHGISKHFLYLNDDFFLVRDTSKEWFYNLNGLPRFFFEPNPIPLRGSHTANDKACAYTLQFIPWRASHKSPAAVPSRTGWRRFLGIPPHRYMTAHVPQLYDRDIIMGLEARFSSEFKATRSHRFRSPDDIALRILYAYSGLAHGKHEAVRLDWNSPDFLFASVVDDITRTQKTLKRLEEDPPRFLCANDDVISDDCNSPVLLYWQELMAKYWPQPSRFERS